MILVIGDILNDSENTHHKFKVDADLFDAKGAKIGTVSGFCDLLPPHQTWRFMATVSDPKVKNVKFASIREN